MYTDNKRRMFLKGTIATGVALVAASAGLLTPGAVMAAWPKSAFDAKKQDEAIQALTGAATHEKSGDIKIKAPSIAENGAVVNISVTTTLSNVESISLLVDQNVFPLAINLVLDPASVEPFAKTRIKIGKTSDVTALIKSNGKIYSASQKVKVTKGGCGG